MNYKAAVIGCGRIGCGFDEDSKRKNISTHAGAYKNNSKTELVALVDLNQDVLKKYAARFNVQKTYTSAEEMLKIEKPDILSICTWNATHHELVKLAVQNNVKAIFCEKPISNNIQNAKDMIKLCRENKVILMIDHQRRFDKTHQEIKKFLDNNGLGRIQQVNFYYTAGIANTGSHMFDLLRLFFGDVDWVKAFKSANLSPNPNDPNFDGIIKFKNDIFCSIHALDVKNYLIFDLNIMGAKGRIHLTNSGFTVNYFEAKDSEFFSGYKELVESNSPITNHPKEFMVNAVQHLVECLNNKNNPISSGEDGLASFELICAFHESAKEGGKKIFLPLNNSEINIESR